MPNSATTNMKKAKAVYRLSIPAALTQRHCALMRRAFPTETILLLLVCNIVWFEAGGKTDQYACVRYSPATIIL
ncbi:hypothetical protein LA635_p1008 (plasmid) [Erwinia amylovora LA635]|uniref:Uncharacterized protein n=1 Tax=Erwinia amylovora TaxID=552 RepID=A0A0N7L012_ERWAM|nr:hypothetical protein LA635_p1008 [Erwinia amylovora LA635]CDK23835.1 hypothetical protein LA637_p1008 [Erwinia amylovora LA637]CDM08134.1 hypothetical protein EAMY692_p20008 [Erwinia amylovora]